MPLIQTRIRVFAFNRATAAPVLSDAANITAKWAKDYGTPTALTDTNPVEAEDGFYYFDLSAGERAVTIIGEIFPESSTSGVQVIGVPAFFLLPPPTVVEISTQIAADIIAEANDWELAAIVFGNYSWDTTLAGPATTAEAFLVSMAGATFDTATDSLEAIRNRGDAAWVTGVTLTGPFTRTITVTDSVSGDPIESVSVRLSLGADTESKLTNASGVASFTVSTGTWTYEIFRSGYAGVIGTVVVSGSGGTAVVLVANSPAAPVNPNNATLRVTCIGEDSQIEPGAVVSIRMIEAPASQVGYGYDGTIATFTADANGIAEREVARGATYEIRREGTYKQWQTYVMPTDEDLILIDSFVQP